MDDENGAIQAAARDQASCADRIRRSLSYPQARVQRGAPQKIRLAERKSLKGPDS
jgi:hypothetical protein